MAIRTRFWVGLAFAAGFRGILNDGRLAGTVIYDRGLGMVKGERETPASREPG